MPELQRNNPLFYELIRVFHPAFLGMLGQAALPMTILGLVVFGALALTSHGFSRFMFGCVSLFCLGRLLTDLLVIMLVGQGILSPVVL